ncbi:hypothetical protein ElyMa_001774000 [Elysia marginata]|uniref:Uncharacterized protein n=1 Tax=Elysia marginata TaxID=1093978 RepID=A0AAV4ED33_9GAST|nr:hypothetical protein ElyMa_001774000 [Elysia marginata]
MVKPVSSGSTPGSRSSCPSMACSGHPPRHSGRHSFMVAHSTDMSTNQPQVLSLKVSFCPFMGAVQKHSLLNGLTTSRKYPLLLSLHGCSTNSNVCSKT